MTAAALILTDNVASVIPRSPAILLIAAIQVAQKSLIGGTCRDAEEGLSMAKWRSPLVASKSPHPRVLG